MRRVSAHQENDRAHSNDESSISSIYSGSVDSISQVALAVPGILKKAQSHHLGSQQRLVP